MELPSSDPIRSLAEEETVLPCRYAPAADVQVVQVTWYKETTDGKEQIITAHQTNGQTGLLLFCCLSLAEATVNLLSRDPVLRLSLPGCRCTTRRLALSVSRYFHSANCFVSFVLFFLFWYCKLFFSCHFLTFDSLGAFFPPVRQQRSAC